MALEELRVLAPPPPVQHLSPERLALQRERLMREIARSLDPGPSLPLRVSPPRRRYRIRRRIVALVLVPAALLGGRVAYSVSGNRSAEQLGNYVTCFQAPDLGAPAAGAPFAGQTLADLCDTQWNSGSIAAPPPGPAPAQWVACQGEGIDVFPGDSQNLCQRLGLQPVPPQYYETVTRYSAMESDLWSWFPDTRCVSDREGTRITRGVLDAHGYRAWTIIRNGFGDLTPCALAPDLDPVNGLATIRGGVRPELRIAVQRGLEHANYCGPEDALLGDVRESMAKAGFADWTVRIDHQLTAQWPCVAGFNEEPGPKSVVLVGYATR